MLRRNLLLVFPILVHTIVQQGLAQTQSQVPDRKYESWKALRSTERFQGPLTFKNKQGRPVVLQVGLRVWSIDGSLGAQELRIEEFMLFTLRAGRLKTTIDGKEEERKADDSWTLPAGATMTVAVKGEAAVLETLTVTPR